MRPLPSWRVAYPPDHLAAQVVELRLHEVGDVVAREVWQRQRRDAHPSLAIFGKRGERESAPGRRDDVDETVAGGATGAGLRNRRHVKRVAQESAGSWAGRI